MSYVKKLLGTIPHVDFKNYETDASITNFYQTPEGMESLINVCGYRHIFFDEAEDLGIDELGKLCRSQGNENQGYFQMMTNVIGHLWVVFDPFQSRRDPHGLGSVT